MTNARILITSMAIVVVLLGTVSAAPSDDKTKDSFDLSDINADGKVTRSEIRELKLKKRSDIQSAESDEAKAQIVSEYKRTVELEQFVRADTDDDLILTREEYDVSVNAKELQMLSAADHIELGNEVFDGLCEIVGQKGVDSIDLEKVSTGAIAQLKLDMKAAGKDVEKRNKASTNNNLLKWIITISMYEKNGDWKVSRCEVQEFHTDSQKGLRPQGFHPATQQRLAEMQAEASVILSDLDNDGKLSKDEVISTKVGTSSSFKRSDTNGDGFIEPWEMEFGLRMHYVARFKKRPGSTDKFVRTDSNRDSEITLDEVRAPAQKWYKRQVDANTKYGAKAASKEGRLYIDMKTFLVSDTDDNSILTREEYDAYSYEMKLSEADCKVLGKEYIQNKSSALGSESSDALDLKSIVALALKRSKNDLAELKDSPEDREIINTTFLSLIREVSACDVNGDLIVTTEELSNELIKNGGIRSVIESHTKTLAFFVDATADYMMLIVDTNEDGEVTEEESKLFRNLSVIKHDEDKNGTTSRSELVKYLANRFKLNREDSGK